MNTQKISRLIITLGIIGTFILSLSYLIKSFKSMKINDNDFINNTSFLFSNITTMVILIYVLRKLYLKVNKKPNLLFSKYSIFIFLIYITIALEILLYNIFQFEITKDTFIIDKIITLSFGICCIITTIYMLKNMDLKNNVA